MTRSELLKLTPEEQAEYARKAVKESPLSLVVMAMRSTNQPPE